jgi:Fe-Mn family superoxide dismutase
MMTSTRLATAAILVASAAPQLILAQPATAPTVQPAPAQVQAFTLDPLPYPFDALNPVIDTQTMTLHHGRHHKSFVDALNKAAAEDSAVRGQSVEALLAKASKLPVGIRNNAGGHWNHRFFWETMAPASRSGAPSPALAAAIDKQFGSLDQMRAAFKTAGTGRFGSGWVWLIVKPDGTLAITSTPNQDNPLMDLAEQKGIPILGNDVWEHAYYLNYQNRRGDYLDAWWQVVNWAKVSDRFAKAVVPQR